MWHKLFNYLKPAAVITASIVTTAFTGHALADDDKHNGKPSKENKDLRVSIQLGHGANHHHRHVPAPVYRGVENAPPGYYRENHRGRGYYRNHGVQVTQHWVPNHHVWRGGVWISIPGFYTTNYVPPMPAAQYELQPSRTYPGWAWVRGHWYWGGVEWIWTPGVWVRI